jgi:cell division protease FtsH
MVEKGWGGRREFRSLKVFVYVLIVVAIIVLLFQFRSQAASTPALTLGDLAAAIKAGEVKAIQVDGDTLHVTYAGDGHVEDTRKEPITTAPDQLIALGVTQQQLGAISWDIKKPSDLSGILTFLGYMLPALLVVGVIYFMLRQAQGTNNQALSFGKSRARMFTGDQPSVTFEDVAGVDEAKEELKAALKGPEKFISLGARIPKGVLLMARRAPARPCWPRPFPARPACPSSRSPAQVCGDVRGVAPPGARPVDQASATRPASCLWTN